MKILYFTILPFLMVVSEGNNIIQMENAETTTTTIPGPNICYAEEYSYRLRVTDGLDLESLSLLDKLKFVDRYSKKSHTKYLNSRNMLTHDVAIDTSYNVFPKYYVPPVVTRIDDVGIRSYFSNDNPNFSEGWEAVLGDENVNTYVSDPDEGTNYMIIDYDEEAQNAYAQSDDLFKRGDILPGMNFQAIDNKMIQQMSNMGLSVVRKGDEVEISDENMIVRVNNKARTVQRDEMENARLTRQTLTRYQYDRVVNDYLVHTTTTITPKTFSNGACYDIVETYTYSNFNVCNEQIDITNRSIVNSQLELEIYPNPASDHITISIPNPKMEADVNVVNATGNIVYFKKIPKDQELLKINIHDLTNGIYNIKLVQAQNSFISKFIKQ